MCVQERQLEVYAAGLRVAIPTVTVNNINKLSV